MAARNAQRVRAERAAGAEATKASMPAWIEPQLATPVERAPMGEGWLHEIKLDGYRILARVEGGAARLISRSGRDWTARFPVIAEALAKLPVDAALIDGEVVVVRADGRTSFQELQGSLQGALQGRADPRLHYFAFDLLHLDGRDLTQAPLGLRKAALGALLAGEAGRGKVRLCGYLEGEGEEVQRKACLLGLEGVVSKRADAPYRSGRNADWRKSKCTRRQEVVIGGFTEPEPGRSGFGALLCGVYDARGALVYVGRVGTGFTEETLRSIRAQLDRLRRERPPFEGKVTGREMGRARWVEPVLVAEVELSAWTEGGHMRHPSFLGLREDKPAEAVVREEPRGP